MGLCARRTVSLTLTHCFSFATSGFPCQHQIFYYGKNRKSFWCARSPVPSVPCVADAQPCHTAPAGSTHASLRFSATVITRRYDPVFQVIKLDGEPVWRKRHYAVRRGKRPGTFVFRCGFSISNELFSQLRHGPAL